MDRSSPEKTRSAWLAQDFLSLPYQAVRSFKRYLDQRVRERMSFLLSPIELELLSWAASAWPNVKGQGSYHLPHVHPHSEMSFVYFLSGAGNVRAIDEDLRRTKRGEVGGGALVFMDPRGAAPYMAPRFTEQFGRDAHVYIPPTEGTLLLFPSYLSHMVAPHGQGALRMSISGNIFDLRILPPSQIRDRKGAKGRNRSPRTARKVLK